jgi:hypothetical protein
MRSVNHVITAPSVTKTRRRYLCGNVQDWQAEVALELGLDFDVDAGERALEVTSWGSRW